MSIASRLQAVRERIICAQMLANRDNEAVRLLAVSKKQSAESVREAFKAGQVSFGENFCQEALCKIRQLNDLPLEWHFIGPIQSNKTRDIACHFDWVQSVDRDKVAKRLNEQRPPEAQPLNVCIQVNISQEPQKAGVPLEECRALAEHVSHYRRLRLRGLMAIPLKTSDESEHRRAFSELNAIYQQLQKDYELDTLSMGMTQDLEVAIAQGSTMVRVGTAIFGERYGHE